MNDCKPSAKKIDLFEQSAAKTSELVAQSVDTCSVHLCAVHGWCLGGKKVLW